MEAHKGEAHRDAAVTEVLKEYDARIARERAIWENPAAAMGRRDELLLAVGPATAQFLATLVRAAHPKIILEIGTSYGYSTIWLGEAARDVDATLHTFEIAPEKADYARERVKRAGLSESVVFHVGDAVAEIAKLAGPFDITLLDLWKDLYIPCFEIVYPKLSRGAFVIADNMLEPEAVRPDAEAYRRHVRGKAGITSVLLPIGSGIEVSRYE